MSKQHSHRVIPELEGHGGCLHPYCTGEKKKAQTGCDSPQVPAWNPGAPSPRQRCLKWVTALPSLGVIREHSCLPDTGKHQARTSRSACAFKSRWPRHSPFYVNKEPVLCSFSTGESGAETGVKMIVLQLS